MRRRTLSVLIGLLSAFALLAFASGCASEVKTYQASDRTVETEPTMESPGEPVLE